MLTSTPVSTSRSASAYRKPRSRTSREARGICTGCSAWEGSASASACRPRTSAATVRREGCPDRTPLSVPTTRFRAGTMRMAAAAKAASRPKAVIWSVVANSTSAMTRMPKIITTSSRYRGSSAKNCWGWA